MARQVNRTESVIGFTDFSLRQIIEILRQIDIAAMMNMENEAMAVLYLVF